MTPFKSIIILGGTHGNETNGVFYVKNYHKALRAKYPHFDFHFIQVNEKAIAENRRFIDRDLNRLNHTSEFNDSEGSTLRDLREQFKTFDQDSTFIFDLHTTTSHMGDCLVTTRKSELIDQILTRIQKTFPKTTILEGQNLDDESSFINNFFKNGLLVEIGPVANGVISHAIITSFDRLIQQTLDCLTDLESTQKTSVQYEYYKSLGQINYPNHAKEITHFVDENICDWKEVREGDVLFRSADEAVLHQGESFYPCFVNEAGYQYEFKAMLKTKKMMK